MPSIPAPGFGTVGTVTPEEILRALADPERLAVAGALARQPMTTTQLADDLELSAQRVRRHLARLAAAGITEVAADRRTHRLRPEMLRAAAREVGPAREAGLALGAFDEEE